MKTIPLTQGRVALVDDEDYANLCRYRWNACQNKGYAFYASRGVWDSKRKSVLRILMHREILGVPSVRIDHIDCNGLNNQKANLRLATQSQNGGNRRKLMRASSHFKGVSWYAPLRKWTAQICFNQRDTRLGYYDSEDEAARAYNAAARQLFGEFARMNPV